MAERDALLARWLELTRNTLPEMAAGYGWPIRFDHCFMRVFLDHAMGGPWHERGRRPAACHMAYADLRRAVEAAERVLQKPFLLPALNAQSLAWRRRQIGR